MFKQFSIKTILEVIQSRLFDQNHLGRRTKRCDEAEDGKTWLVDGGPFPPQNGQKFPMKTKMLMFAVSLANKQPFCLMVVQLYCNFKPTEITTFAAKELKNTSGLVGTLEFS